MAQPSTEFLIVPQSRYAWARLYPNKLPLTAAHTLNNEVVPTFEAEGATIDAVLSDNGREFCGREDQHPYELFLQLEGNADAFFVSNHHGRPNPINRTSLRWNSKNICDIFIYNRNYTIFIAH